MNVSQDAENNLLNTSTNSSLPNLSDSTLSFLADEREHSTGTVKISADDSSKDSTTVIIGDDSTGDVIVISSDESIDSEGIFCLFLFFFSFCSNSFSFIDFGSGVQSLVILILFYSLRVLLCRKRKTSEIDKAY